MTASNDVSTRMLKRAGAGIVETQNRVLTKTTASKQGQILFFFFHNIHIIEKREKKLVKSTLKTKLKPPVQTYHIKTLEISFGVLFSLNC